MDTETLDRLYLEWSQFTSARTEREKNYKSVIEKALEHLRLATPQQKNGPCYQAIAILKAAVE